MKTQEQIQLINDTINKTKENLKSSAPNFIFWGALIATMSLIHYGFPEIIQKTRYSALIYWVSIPILGMALTVIYNIKKREKRGFETHIGRALKIIWGVFNIAWLVIVVLSIFKKQNPVQEILFLLGIVLLISALLIRFTPLIIGAIAVISCSVLIAILPSINVLLINAVATFVGLVIPGLSLYLSKKHV